MTDALGAAMSVLALAFPLALASALLVRPLHPVAIRLAPWAATPALLLGLGWSRTPTLHSDVLLFGTSLGMGDEVARGFVVLTASVWLASGVFARTYVAEDPRRARFWAFFLLTEVGNLGLALAGDAASFYLFFAVMTYAAYGLIVHEQSDEARRAARIYLVMALVGEMLLLVAFLMIVGSRIDRSLGEAARFVAVSPHRTLLVGLLLAGFGVKAGALVLHMWLPLAHPVAPTPASAVLSGAMIKAGMLGWLRFLPLGIVALPGAGLVCLVAGLGAAYYGVLVGVTQRRPKTILAYSSISQMGFMIAALGTALATPAAASVAVAAILFFALHHAFAKSALFLGTGVAAATGAGRARTLVMLGLAWPALEIAGAPLSSGALAKISLKNVLAASPWHSAPLGALLSLGAIGSTLLLAHFLRQVAPRQGRGRPSPGLWVPWVALLVLDLILFVQPPVDRRDLELLVHPGNILSALWPVLAGVVLFALAAYLRRRGLRGLPRIPPGDLVVMFERAVAALRRAVAALGRSFAEIDPGGRARASAQARFERAWGVVVRSSVMKERALSTFGAIGVMVLLAITLGMWLAWRT